MLVVPALFEGFQFGTAGRAQGLKTMMKDLDGGAIVGR